MKRKLIVLTFVALLSIPGLASAEYTFNSKEFQNVVKQLDMQGHADHDLSTCSIKNVYYDEVLEMLQNGMTEEEIIESYVDQYGQAALREPSGGTTGFIAWLMPVAGFITGAFILGFGLKRFIRKPVETVSQPHETMPGAPSLEDDILAETIEAERKKYF